MKKILTRTLLDTHLTVHPDKLLNRIYLARGVTSAEELDYGLANLLPYKTLLGIEQAVQCLGEALEKQQNILIVGDFDVDGATSVALAIRTLRAFGFNNVSYLIPNRFDSGYGLTPEIVKLAAEKNTQLIITVDNGISSVTSVDLANELGIRVLLTDHHLPGHILPQAYAIINPNQPSDQFLSKHLVGVGVIFYVMLALRAYLREQNWFQKQSIPEPNMAQFLDLVALGTVADVASLDYNNRILVAQGIQRIRAGKCCVGIKALLAVSKRRYENVSTADLGFAVAPRINAVGRLDDMSLGVECLLTDDVVQARLIASKLEAVNNERRVIEGDMQGQALRLLDALQLKQDLPPGLCVFEETWHQGVLGVLASRLKERLNRPVIAFTALGDLEMKGSARSVRGIHIREILSNISEQNPGLITRYGGHAMAAGLSITKEGYDLFSQLFADQTARFAELVESNDVVYTDGELSEEYFDIVTARLLRNAGPWGQDFVEPVFVGIFNIIDQRLVGRKHLKLTLQHPDVKKEISAICFNVNTDEWPNYRCSKIKLVYRLDVNEYNGSCNLQLIVEEIISHE